MKVQKYDIWINPAEGDPVPGALVYEDNEHDEVHGFISAFDQETRMATFVFFAPTEIPANIDALNCVETCDWNSIFVSISEQIMQNKELLEQWTKWVKS